MNTLLADHQPPAPPLFPLPDGSIRQGARMFRGYVDEELQAIAAGNLETLPDDSPARYLLEGHARPDIPPEEPGYAYQTGVCMGVALVRRRTRQLAEAGHALEEPAFDAAQGPVFGTRVRKWLPAPLKTLLQYEADSYDIYARPTEFFADPEAIAYIGVLKAAWLGQGVGFLDHESIARGDDDYFTLGLSDSLATYAGLYQNDDARRLRDVTFNPRKHIRKRDKDRAAKGVAIEWSFAEGILDETVEDPLEGFGTTRLATGYRADTRLGPRQTRISVDRWWKDEVPLGSAIVDVRRFSETTVFAGSSDFTRHDEVALKRSVETFRLGKQDWLVIQNGDDALAAIGYPFRIEHDMLGDSAEQSVRLLSLCRRGEAAPLVDITRLDEAMQEELQRLTAQIAEQQQAERYNRIGAFLLDKVLPHSSKANTVVPAAAGTAGVFAEGLAYQSVTSLLISVGVLGLLKLAKRVSVLRREKVPSPEPIR